MIAFTIIYYFISYNPCLDPFDDAGGQQSRRETRDINHTDKIFLGVIRFTGKPGKKSRLDEFLAEVSSSICGLVFLQMLTRDLV